MDAPQPRAGVDAGVGAGVGAGALPPKPRAALARRFGKALVQRLDQALGSTHEPICPLRAPTCFAVRLSLPEPIGLRDDIIAALDRLLPRLCLHLKAQSQGARHIRLEAFRSDATMDAKKALFALAVTEGVGYTRGNKINGMICRDTAQRGVGNPVKRRLRRGGVRSAG